MQNKHYLWIHKSGGN